MTADDARKLTAAALATDGELAQVWFRCWVQAIEKAAKEGKSSVREGAVGQPRCTIPPAAKEAALKLLVDAGFKVKTVGDGRNETTTEVSWDLPRIPPRGGSGTAPRFSPGQPLTGIR